MQLARCSCYFYIPINFFQLFSVQLATEFTTRCIIETEEKLRGYRLTFEASAKRREGVLPPFREGWNGKTFSDVEETCSSVLFLSYCSLNQNLPLYPTIVSKNLI